MGNFGKVQEWVTSGISAIQLFHIFFLSSTAVATGHFDLTSYPDVNTWFEKVKGEIPNYEKACGKGANEFGGWFKMMKSKK